MKFIDRKTITTPKTEQIKYNNNQLAMRPRMSISQRNALRKQSTTVLHATYLHTRLVSFFVYVSSAHEQSYLARFWTQWQKRLPTLKMKRAHERRRIQSSSLRLHVTISSKSLVICLCWCTFWSYSIDEKIKADQRLARERERVLLYSCVCVYFLLCCLRQTLNRSVENRMRS